MKLKYAAFALLVGVTHFLFAIPHANNSKSKAIVITITDDCIWGSLTSPYTYNLTKTTLDERKSGVWYRFTPTSRGFEINRQGSQVKVEVTCDDPSAVITSRVVSTYGIAYEVNKLNIPYYITFTNQDADIYNFCLYTSAGNDEQVTAELVTDGNYCVEKRFVFSNSTKSAGTFSCKSFDTDYRDIWYKFVASATNYTLTATKATSPTFSIAVIDSLSGSQVACENGLFGTKAEPSAKAVVNLTSLTKGSKYFIKVLNYVTNGDLTLNLCLQPKITSIEDANTVNMNSIFPNPSNGTINIDTKEIINQVIVTNSLGQQEIFYASSFSSSFFGLVVVEVHYKSGFVSKNRILIQ